MKIDLTGRHPKNRTGERFRTNSWWWTPLALFIEENAKIRLSAEGGDGLTEDESMGLALVLDAALTGEAGVEFVKRAHRSEVGGLFTLENSKDFVTFLKNCGGFEIYSS
jgi:hypothetical protein